MKINGTTLSMIRGDSESLTVTCRIDDGTEEGMERPFVAGDRVDFTVKYGYEDRVPVLHKVITEFVDGAAIIPIEPEDTRGQTSGGYRYDIQFTAADGTVITIMGPGTFELEADITDG